MLEAIDLRDNYSSDDSNISEELFGPCLRVSELYFRSVGYLDSKVFALLGREFEAFAARGSRARLLIGRTVTLDDYLAIKQGKLNPERFLTIPDLDALWVQLGADETKRKGLLVVSWLVSRSVLEIRFSVRPRGIHHDKFAFFADSTGHEVVVHGTNNETEAASLPDFNYESLSVFRSWEREIFQRHGEYKLREFLRLWEGKSPSALSIEAPHPVLERIASFHEDQRQTPLYLELFEQLQQTFDAQKALPRIPMFWGDQRYRLLEHQRTAINAFFANDYNGIFALATGSGKTLAALHAATTLAREMALTNDVDVVVLVAVPYQVLADQWVENLRRFGYSPITAYSSIGNWFQDLELAVNRATFRPAARVTAVVVVNRTLQSDTFQTLIGQFNPSQLIFIGDECHRLGPLIEKGKTPKAEYRLGLSATPWAPNEESLRHALTSYFRQTVAHYGLADAFADRVLVPYEYILIHAHLNGDEGALYSKHTAEAKRLQAIKMSGGEINEDQLNFHLNQRAAVLGSADAKFEKLPEVLRDVRDKMGLRHLLVYCGSGSSEDDDAATGSVRDIERAQIVAAQSVNLESARVTASESAEIRRSILAAFESGALHAVFAIKVLDEGFDMPGVKGAILLASSRNERQFVQRRGRVLRKAEGKDRAVIWDFIVSGDGVMPTGHAQELAQLELLRALEFARLSTDWDGHKAKLAEYAARFQQSFDVLLDQVTQSRYEEAPR